GHHADALGQLDERHDVRAVAGVAARSGPMVDAGRVHDALAAGLAPLDGGVGVGGGDLAGGPHRGLAARAPRPDATLVAGGVPERLAHRADRRLDAGGHSVPSVPSTTVPIVDSTPPDPWATATSWFSIWRRPASPRSWRTASTSRNIPYIPGWV